MRRFLPAALLVLGLVGHLWLQALPAWRSIQKAPSGRDFASYYYALQVAADGGNPYDTDAMEVVARADRTRTQVHPFFYPPPFLGSVYWAKPLSLFDAFQLGFVLNELVLFGSLALGVVAFGVPVWAVAALLWTWTPIPDNAWMGQANLLALLPALAGLALNRRGRPILGGTLVGVAAMLKMSPALFLLHWAIRREWKPVLAAMATALALTLCALPLVGLDAQVQFYRDILPGFSRGDYHGLAVPISLPANHSIPDLYDRLFPADGRFLSAAAQRAATATSLALLLAWAWRARVAVSEPATVAALTVLMVAVPVYTYEHHLVFLLVAVGIAAGQVQGRAREAWRTCARGAAVGWWVALVATWFVLAWPLRWLRAVQALLPADLGWVCRESKTMGEAGLFVMLLVLAAPQPSREK